MIFATFLKSEILLDDPFFLQKQNNGTYKTPLLCLICFPFFHQPAGFFVFYLT